MAKTHWVVLATLLFPVAQAAAVSGSIAFPDGASLHGAARATATQGLLDLAPALGADETLTFTFASARGHVLSSTREYLMDSAYVGESRSNESLEWGAGVLRGLSCAEECKAFAYAAEGGVVGIAGSLAGPLVRIGREETYWTGWAEEGGPDGFQYSIPAQWLALVGGPHRGPSGVTDAVPLAFGHIGLVLWGVTMEAEHDGRVEALRTGTSRTPMEGPLGTPIGTRSVARALVLELEGAALEARAGSLAALYGASPDVSLKGDLFATRAEGDLRVDGKRVPLEGGSLRVGGQLQVQPRFDAEGLLPSDPVPRASVEGEAERVIVGGTVVAQEGSGVAAGLAATGGVVALLVLAKVGAFAWLYTRLVRASILANPNRRQVLDAIEREPGVHVLPITRITGLAEGVVRHHLRVLLEHGFVVEREQGGLHGYFTRSAHLDPAHQDGLLVLKDETRRRIAEAVAVTTAPLSQRDLAEALGISLRLVSYHLGRLEAAGLVRAEGTMPRRYAPAPTLLDVLDPVALPAAA